MEAEAEGVVQSSKAREYKRFAHCFALAWKGTFLHLGLSSQMFFPGCIAARAQNVLDV